MASCRLRLAMLGLLALGVAPAREVQTPSLGNLAKHAFVQYAAQALEDKWLTWEGPVGRRALGVAQSLSQTVCRLIAAMPDLATKPEMETLRANTALVRVEANVTRCAIGGLASIRPFELAPSGPARFVSASSFGRLKVNVTLAIKSTGPFGATYRDNLTLVTEFDGCTTELEFVCRVHPGALQTMLSGGHVDRQGLDASLAAVRVHIAGDFTLRLVRAAGGGLAPDVVWRLVSKAASAMLKPTVEEAIAAAVQEAIAASLAVALDGRPSDGAHGAEAEGGGSLGRERARGRLKQNEPDGVHEAVAEEAEEAIEVALAAAPAIDPDPESPDSECVSSDRADRKSSPSSPGESREDS